jgi:carbamoyltransferase
MEREILLEQVAQYIADQKVVGWFQGRMEYGPRALRSRSILADARNAENWKRVNLKIKFRESFRPFAPTVLEERLNEYFESDIPSPFMLFTSRVKNGQDAIPAVTHVDGSARLQSINCEQNSLYYDLIKSHSTIVGEFWQYMKIRKKWWLLPIIVVLVLVGFLVVVTHGSALAPFIYTIF